MPDKHDDIEAFWAKVESWTRTAAMPPDLLRAAATARELDELDKALATRCPPSLRALLARHNGAGHDWYCFGGGFFLTTGEIVALRLERSRLAAELFGPAAGSPECLGAVRPLWWSDLWIPFMKRNKDPVCIDLNPATGGTVGQIIEIDWEGRCNSVLADRLETFLARLLATL